MSFKEVLEKVGGRVQGALGVVAIGDDGIVVERHIIDSTLDAELASVEYMQGCREIRKAVADLQTGEVEEVTVVTEKAKMLMRRLGPGYSLVLIMGPEGTFGRGRYELKKASYELAPEFL